ncbi:neuroepithelial cell-transforming gene 1 protein-like [Sphaeramia orbicularis]|uniref:neuroepithelial cell-transforming gene 1 protein-like n=1 Tax=Sphaeramia orbicularis TaxID=375764 RepID=UPI00117EADB0|nr:neuroepithelial cell-transforming gene 1 protein-like [Sphaeramia orbicularis]
MGESGEVQAPVSTIKEKLKRQPSSRNLKRKFSSDEDECPLENSRGSLRRSLRRGSSFTFLTPAPQWDFTLKRKRREKDDSDAVSLCSFDFKRMSSSDHSVNKPKEQVVSYLAPRLASVLCLTHGNSTESVSCFTPQC